MRKSMVHTIIGSAICLSTMLLYLALYQHLSDMVPIHWNIRGQANNYIPKPAFVFGVPIGFLMINLLTTLKLKDETNWLRYYIVPLISLLAVVLTISLGLK